MAGKEKIDGATTAAFRKNHKRIREQRDMTWAQESRFLKSLGWEIPPLALKRIEIGERRVDLDDLMALALALDVSPMELLLPHDDGETAEITGAGVVPIERARAWLSGQSGLGLEETPGRGLLLERSSDPLSAVIDFSTTAESSVEAFLSSEKFKNAVREAMGDAQ